MYDTDVGVEVMDADDHEPVQSIYVVLHKPWTRLESQGHATVHTNLR